MCKHDKHLTETFTQPIYVQVRLLTGVRRDGVEDIEAFIICLSSFTSIVMLRPLSSLSSIALLVMASMASASRSWEEAYEKAGLLVSQMSIEQKVNITSGTGMTGLCAGVTGSTENPDFAPLCLHDGPLGVRAADNVSYQYARHTIRIHYV